MKGSSRKKKTDRVHNRVCRRRKRGAEGRGDAVDVDRDMQNGYPKLDRVG